MGFTRGGPRSWRDPMSKIFGPLQAPQTNNQENMGSIRRVGLGKEDGLRREVERGTSFRSGRPGNGTR